MPSHFGLPVVSAVLLVIAVVAPTRAEADDLKHHRQPRQIPCADLANLNLPDTTITLAQEVPAGPFPFGDTAPTCASDIASPQLPAFCRVVGVVAPQITFEVWLPLENWNRKFEAFGNHGFAGNIEYSDMGPELVKGYAIAGTDTGHAGNAPLPWMQNEQQVIDYGHRGVHEMTVMSKAIVEAFYGQPARYSYFNGCSTGGKEGLMEAQRYPDDYDGIVVGTPNFAQIHNRAQYVWNGQVTFANPETTLSAAKLPLINNAAVAACDAIDGIVDGVIDDPRSCPFQPASLLCSFGQDPNTCLTAAQVGALENVYAGPRNPRTGEEVYPGLVRGSELGWGGHTTGPNIFSTADQFFKFMVYNDPNWDYKTFDFDTDLAFTDANFSQIIDAIDPDLRAFRNHGGKILHYHAWSSTVHTGTRSIEYYEDVVSFIHSGKARGEAFAKTQEFYRLFMAPGGSGSKGPSTFDPLPYLERWVEHGIPPKKIIAHHSTSGVVDRTRPLCPYPQVAVYKGSSSTDDAANFVCRDPRDRERDHHHDNGR
jgi:feruloyl esterase